MALDFSTILTGHYGEMIVKGATVTLELALGAWLLAMLSHCCCWLSACRKTASLCVWWQLTSRITAMCPR
ncbi:hypothetical protein HMPREF1502_1603 [Klebsiella sp. AS10]|nr:hypothetical protein HMPREF1502_1603 [Klebsiella sp. AS10]